MSTLTVFANFFIDTPERFIRVQDSFKSFRDVKAEKWVINVRGRFADQVTTFLMKELGEKLISFRLHSQDGWFFDTRQMLSAIDGDYVFFWLEDHLNMAETFILDSIVEELKENNADYMYYSFWWGGALRQRYQGIPMTPGRHIDWFNHTVDNNPTIQGNAKEGVFLIAVCSIFKSDLFRKIVLTDDPVPKRWPKETPFDFEKCPTDVHWLPLQVALPRQELFASIDDDHVHPGSSLISRGLYPCREQRQTYAVTNKVSIQGRMGNLLAKSYRRILSFFCFQPKKK
ncbi:MAG: hypothetical protein HYV06_07560 [Deltaproteobacteria bacterium]|nr:hypothetical protein [Deltaproteobacteria bacterium]